MSKIADVVFQACESIATSQGIELVEVEYVRKQNGMNLILYIDKPEGITLGDCEKFHLEIDPLLDELDPTNGASYTLNVSSLGLDRPLKTMRDYARNLNKKIRVKLFFAIEKRKEFIGILTSYDEKTFMIDTGKETLTFEKDKVAHVEPEIEF